MSLTRHSPEKLALEEARGDALNTMDMIDVNDPIPGTRSSELLPDSNRPEIW